MKQLLQDLKSGKMEVTEVPAPSPGPGQVLVRVRFSAVSVGTERAAREFAQAGWLGKARLRPDLVRRTWDKIKRDGLIPAWEAASAQLDQPMPLGYSCSGVVVEIGSGTHRLRVGDKVACGGAGYANHAEFICVPENLCAALPPESDLEEAAFITLGSVALNGFRLGQAQLGESVAVIGLGILGQLTAQIAKAAGCRVLGVDADAARVEAARIMGLEQAVLRHEAEAAAAAFTQGRGVDLALVAAASASSDAVSLAGEIARDRATVVVIGAVGMDVPRDIYYRKELSLRVARSYGPGRYDPVYEEGGQDYPYAFVRWTEERNMEEVGRLLGSGQLKVRPLVTHRFPIERALEAYEMISGKSKEPFLGIVLTYGEDASLAKKVDVGGGEIGTGARVTPAQGIGVLGAGQFAASTVLPILRDLGASFRGIASASGTRAKAAADRFGFAWATSDEKEVLGDPQTGIVAVLTRHHLHAAQVCAALAAGKHVFVEKPLCLSLEELEAIEEAKGASGLHVEVGFNRKFAPYTRKIKELMDNAAGPKSILIRVHASALPENHWLLDPSQGGGRLLGEGCHFIDWSNFIVGQAPGQVYARAVGARADQDWSVNLGYADGSSAEILYTTLGNAGVGKERYEVHARDTSAALEDFRSLKVYSPRGKKTYRSWLRSDKGHARQWEQFLACVRAEKPLTPWPDTVGSMKTVFAALESLRSGRIQILEL